VTWPITEIRSTARAIPKRKASQRWPRIVSTSESEESTPTSIIMNRKSIITAPA
jgi:hypothetical protein